MNEPVGIILPRSCACEMAQFLATPERLRSFAFRFARLLEYPAFVACMWRNQTSQSRSLPPNWRITARGLRYWFPGQCVTLTARARQARLDVFARHQASQCRIVKTTVQVLQYAGRCPLHRQVNAIIRKECMVLAQPHILKAYREAVAPRAELQKSESNVAIFYGH